MSTTSESVALPQSRIPSLGSRGALVASAVLLLLVIGCTYLFLTRGQVSTDDAQIDGRLVPISPKISGYISDLLVDDNQLVTKGQIIARIDSRDEQVKVAQAQAALEIAKSRAAAASRNVPLTSSVTSSAAASAEARLADAKAELLRSRSTAEKAHHADMSHAAANVADRKANYERAHSDLLRMQELIGKHEISQLQFDRYLAEERIAKSQLEAAEQSLAAQKDVAEISDAAVHASEAKVREATAQLAEAHSNQQQVGIRTTDATLCNESSRLFSNTGDCAQSSP